MTRSLMKSKKFKKDQEVFVVANYGSHHTVQLEKIFRAEEVSGGEMRYFMYSNSSACVLQKDIFADESAAEHEAARRNRK